MSFYSILYNRAQDRGAGEVREPPDFFRDLNLDQVVDAVTATKADYDLKPFYYAPLTRADAIVYRHEVMRDLEQGALLEAIQAFARSMRMMREHLAQAEKLYSAYQKQAWFLDAVAIYCDAASTLARALSAAAISSRGLLALRAYLTEYVASARFVALADETQSLKTDLAAVQYCMLIKGSTIRVRACNGEADYSAEIAATFAKFQQGAAKDYRVQFATWPEMNHVEERVLHMVARLHPDLFERLAAFRAGHTTYLDETIAVFDREVQFYVAWLEFMAAFRRGGLAFCYPRVSRQSKEVFTYDGFDLALAYKLLYEQTPVVCNDFHLQGKERIIIVSGPNQGGKTTFARTFGQLHYLACLGCPVPGSRAQLYLFDRLFTHFEQEEDLNNLRGKLQDDLVRIHEILTQATTDSLIIINEIFTSTTLQDAVFLGKRVMEWIIRLDLLCVCVTFIDELAALGEKVVSMVSTVAPENPSVRTYRIVRRPADGLSYALSIAEKYRLTYAHLKERTRS